MNSTKKGGDILNKFIYAQLNGSKVFAITYTTGELKGENLIDVSEHENPDSLLGATYDGENFILSQPAEPTQAQELPTIEEQILAETQYQTALLETNTIGGN